MQAIVQKGYGAPERVLELADVPRPSFGDQDVLVRVRATCVNTPDWITVAGVPRALRLRSGLRQPRTTIRGTDVAGVVEAVGASVNDFRTGDEVLGSSWDKALTPTAGTFAELSVVRASQLVLKPSTLTFEEAAASVMSGLTALIAMRDVGRVGEGTRVLINGSSGGIGTLAVQIAKALGADVTGVCSTRNLELVRSLGADRVIDYTKEDFTRSEARYDVIFDNVMNHSPNVTARVLSLTGRLIPNSVGNAGGLFAGLPRMARAAVLGLGRTDVRFVTCEVNRENLRALVSFLVSGDVRVVIDKVYPLAAAADAVAHMLGHHARGKIVITAPGPPRTLEPYESETRSPSSTHEQENLPPRQPGHGRTDAMRRFCDGPGNLPDLRGSPAGCGHRGSGRSGRAHLPVPDRGEITPDRRAARCRSSNRRPAGVHAQW
jgi:NADPH:quinone reductase-like Zn-dependent oxidoreductase